MSVLIRISLSSYYLSTPDHVAGSAIPLEVRIISVADYFASVIGERPYHPARTMAEGLAMLHAEAVDKTTKENRFDPMIVRAMGLAIRRHKNEHLRDTPGRFHQRKDATRQHMTGAA